MKTVWIFCLLLASCSNPANWNWAAVYSMKKTEKQENAEWKRFAEAYAEHVNKEKP